MHSVYRSCIRTCRDLSIFGWENGNSCTADMERMVLTMFLRSCAFSFQMLLRAHRNYEIFYFAQIGNI